MRKRTMIPIRREILLVDDSPSDLDLMREALAASAYQSRVISVPDGEEGIAYLHRAGVYSNAARPNLVILDLNLPRKDGRVVLADFKSDPGLRSVPVVVFTTSHSRQDIARCYAIGANCYVSKPGNLKDFRTAVQAIEQFWFSVASVPD